VPWPPAPSFDLRNGIRRWERASRPFYQADWEKAAIPIVMDESEAQFWLFALSVEPEVYRELRGPDPFGQVREEARVDAIRNRFQQYDPSLDRRPEIEQRLAYARIQSSGDPFSSVIVSLIGFEALVELILDPRDRRYRAVAAAHEAERASAARDEGHGRLVFQSILVEENGVSRFVTTQVPPPSPPPEPARPPGCRLFACPGFHPGLLSLYDYDAIVRHVAFGFYRRVAPYLSNDQVALLEDRIRVALRDSPYIGRTTPYNRGVASDPALILAAAIGFAEPLIPVLESYLEQPNAEGSNLYAHSELQLYAIACGDPALGARFLKEQQVGFAHPQEVRDWLFMTEGRGVEIAYDRVREQAGGESAAAFVEALGAVITPDVADAMLRLVAEPKAYIAARAWLEAHEIESRAVLERSRGIRGVIGETANEILARFERRNVANGRRKV
jgi:hypothetical protein